MNESSVTGVLWGCEPSGTTAPPCPGRCGRRPASARRRRTRPANFRWSIAKIRSPHGSPGMLP
eukprot:10485107-Alexandrium_andersonii.AAC.1